MGMMRRGGEQRCGRCGAVRRTPTGVCPTCGYAILVTAEAEPQSQSVAETGQTTTPTASEGSLIPAKMAIWQRLVSYRPHILVGGLLAIISGQLLFHRASGSNLPMSGVFAILLGTGLVAFWGVLSKSMRWRPPFGSRNQDEPPTDSVGNRNPIQADPNHAPGVVDDQPLPDENGASGEASAQLSDNAPKVPAGLPLNRLLRFAAPVVAAILLPVLLWRIWGDRGTAWDIALWIVIIVGFSALFIPARRVAGASGGRAIGAAWLFDRFRAGRQSLFSTSARQRVFTLLPLLAIVVIYCAITLPNLTAWRYSHIGDEFVFYEHATRVIAQGVTRPFSQDGVYDHHPELNTIYKAAVMMVFGDGHFGWKMTGVVSMVLSTAGIYLLAYVLGNRKTAIATAGFFAASHYLLGLLYGGFDHLDALIVTVWALTLFVIGLRKMDPLVLYFAGAVVGLGLYFNYSARIVGPVMLLVAIASVHPRRYLALWPIVLGFLLAAWPTLLTAQEEIVTKMLAQSVGGYSEVVSGPVAERLVSNLSLNLPAFHFNNASHTYVSGPLLDPITGALAVVGIGLAIASPTRMSAKLCLLWVVVTFAATGLISPYPTTAITRMYLMVAPLALLAGLAASRLLELAPTWPPASRYRVAKAAPAAALTALLVATLWLNVQRSWFGTHEVFHYTAEALAVGAMRSEHCDGRALQTVFVGTTPDSSLGKALASYHGNNPPVRILPYHGWPADGLLPGPQGIRCVIFLQSDTREARALQADLSGRYPEGELYTFTTPSRKAKVEYFYLAGEPTDGR